MTMGSSSVAERGTDNAVAGGSIPPSPTNPNPNGDERWLVKVVKALEHDVSSVETKRNGKGRQLRKLST